MIKSTVSLPKYKCKVILLIGTTLETDKVIHELCIKHGIKHTKGTDAGCVITVDSLYYLVLSKQYLTLDLFTHEIGGHLAPMIYVRNRRKVTGQNEDYAKLCGRLANKVGKLLQSNKIKINYARL